MELKVNQKVWMIEINKPSMNSKHRSIIDEEGIKIKEYKFKSNNL